MLCSTTIWQTRVCNNQSSPEFKRSVFILDSKLHFPHGVQKFISAWGSNIQGSKIHFWLGVQKFIIDLGFKSSLIAWGSKVRGSKVHFWLGVQKFTFNLGFKSSFLTWGSKVHFLLGDQKSRVQMSWVQTSRVQKFIAYLELKSPGIKSYRFKSPEINSLGFKSSFSARGSIVWGS